MWYGENGTVKFLETLADNVFTHNYSMIQIKTNEPWENFGVTQTYTLKLGIKGIIGDGGKLTKNQKLNKLHTTCILH